MEFRKLGHSGLMVPVLSFGTGTFFLIEILQLCSLNSAAESRFCAH